MIHYVKLEKKLLAIIIKANYNSKGIEFFTPDDFSQQLGYMQREKDYVINPHLHNSVKREVSYTKEVLFIKSGKVRVDFYDEEKIYFESRILNQGDVILLAFGGHGFKMIESSEIIEVKQGPYSGNIDKSLFNSISDDQIKIKED
jgi:hypothetical protein